MLAFDITYRQGIGSQHAPFSSLSEVLLIIDEAVNSSFVREIVVHFVKGGGLHFRPFPGHFGLDIEICNQTERISPCRPTVLGRRN